MNCFSDFFKTTLVLIIFSMMVACGGAEERQAAYLKKAMESYENGDYDKAKIDIKNVLQINPKHSEATYMLGLLAERSRDYRKAIGYYQKAVELDDKNIDARYSLGKFYLQLSDKDKAQSEVDTIEAVAPGSAQAKALRAAMAFSEKKYSRAIEIVNEIDPDDRDENTYILQAASYYGVGNKIRMYEVLNEGIQVHEKSVQLRLVMARGYIEDDDKDNAVKYLKQIINIEPDNLSHYNALAAYYDKTGDKKNAKKVYADLVATDPRNEQSQLLMVQYIAANNSEADAVNYLRNLIENYPGVDTYTIMLARFELKAGNTDDAVSILHNIIKTQATEKGVNSAKNLLALIKASNDDLAGAKSLLNEILEKSPADTDANLALGKILMKEGNPGDAVGPLRVVIRDDPKNTEAYMLLAKAHEKLGEKDLVYDVVSHGFREVPTDPQIADAFVGLLMTKGEYEYAKNIIDNSNNKNLSADSKYLRAKVYIANNELEKAAALGKELVTELPKKDPGYTVLADIYLKQKQIGKAQEIIRQGLAETKSPGLLVNYVKLKLAIGEIDDVISYLNGYSEFRPLVNNLLAELYAAKKDYATSEKYYRQAIDLSPDWNVPYLSLATIQKNQGDYESALKTYKAALDNVKEVNEIRFMMATTYQNNGNIEESNSLYRQIINEDPNNVAAINNLAQAIVDNNNDESSLTEALGLVEKIKNNNNPAIMDTVAWVYTKNGKYDEAIDIFADIVSKQPDIGIFKYHLGMAYYLKGDNTNARQYLEESIDSKGEAGWKNDARDLLDKLGQA